jgi:2,4-dienoyl-CoA reductase-like NADH-dependent reductase (Old Yellow Enzyme family)
MDGGISSQEAVEISKHIASLIDGISVSTGALDLSAKYEIKTAYQIPYAENIKKALPNMNVFGAGSIFTMDEAKEVVNKSNLDAVNLARELLGNPNFVLNTEKTLRASNLVWPYGNGDKK